MLVKEVTLIFFKNTVWSVFKFVPWWYGRGALKVANFVMDEVRSTARSLNIGILFQFLLTPMFGQTDIWGRIISVGVRLVHFCILFFVSCLAAVLWFVLLIFWLLLPPLVILNILYHLGIIPNFF